MLLLTKAMKESITHPSIRRPNSLSRENIDRVVDIKEIVDNNYNLNVRAGARGTGEREARNITEVEDICLQDSQGVGW